MTQVLCWDIDGTLLSTARAGVFALEDATREVCGVEPDFSAMRTAGLTDWEVALLSIETAGLEPAPETASAFLRCYERQLPERLHCKRGQTLRGVTEILDALSDRPEIISLLLTGNTEAGARAKLAHYGLSGYFTAGAFCTDGDNRVAIARRARAISEQEAGEPLPAEALVVIGDTPADVRCGQAIGARTVAVASGGYALPDLEATGPTFAYEHLPAPEELVGTLGLGTGTGRTPE